MELILSSSASANELSVFALLPSTLFGIVERVRFTMVCSMSLRRVGGCTPSGTLIERVSSSVSSSASAMLLSSTAAERLSNNRANEPLTARRNAGRWSLVNGSKVGSHEVTTLRASRARISDVIDVIDNERLVVDIVFRFVVDIDSGLERIIDSAQMTSHSRWD